MEEEEEGEEEEEVVVVVGEEEVGEEEEEEEEKKEVVAVVEEYSFKAEDDEGSESWFIRKRVDFVFGTKRIRGVVLYMEGGGGG